MAEMTDKVNPRHILNRQVENVKDSLASAGDSILGRTAGSAIGVRGALQGVSKGAPPKRRPSEPAAWPSRLVV